MRIANLVVVGVGLLGGSIALAARSRGVAARVLGVDRDPDSLRQARERGMLDEGGTDLVAAAGEADVLVFCTPVDLIAAQVMAAAPACRPGALLTDVGSTKAAIVHAIEGRLPPGVAFVGGHPLAGSEKNGPGYATAHLLEGRQVIVTRTPHTDPAALDRAAAFWEALGAWVRVMDPDAHDRALALTSHLPHVVAAALASTLPSHLHDLTATGFRDTTRLAAGDPALWGGILSSNQANVLAALDRFGDQLRRFHDALAAGDRAALECLLAQGKDVKEAVAHFCREHPPATS